MHSHEAQSAALRKHSCLLKWNDLGRPQAWTNLHLLALVVHLHRVSRRRIALTIGKPSVPAGKDQMAILRSSSFSLSS